MADIVKRLPREDLLTVGVFRDEAPRRVVEIVYAAGLGAAQLQGRETPDEARWVRQRVPMVIKALPGGDPRVAHADDYGADAILLDAPNAGIGQVFDWAMASDLPGGPAPGDRRRPAPRQRGRRHHAGQTLGRRCHLGVEAAPGVKDPMKVKAFLEAAKRAEAQLSTPAAGPPESGAMAPYDWAEDE